jgi:hypothetical protein
MSFQISSLYFHISSLNSHLVSSKLDQSCPFLSELVQSCPILYTSIVFKSSILLVFFWSWIAFFSTKLLFFHVSNLLNLQFFWSSSDLESLMLKEVCCVRALASLLSQICTILKLK